ncbi:MAG: hypothetical protein ACYCWE_02930 [Eubacteriales bacterium]
MTKEQKIKCHVIIHGASAAAAGVGAGLAQIPLSDNVIITPIQIGMIISLGAVIEIHLSKSAATAILATVATGTIGRGISQVLLGWIPGVGNTVNASTAAAITEAAGWATMKYFENLSDTEKKNYNSAKKDGCNEAAAKFDAKLKKINTEFKEVCNKLRQYKDLEDFTMAAFAIGIAAANIDGEISDEERYVLELSVLGLGCQVMPEGIRGRIAQMFYNKPTFNDALKLIEKVDKSHWKLFDQIIEIVLSIDNFDSEQKAAFRTAWDEKYKAE